MTEPTPAIVITPNADGLIDTVGLRPTEPPEGLPNPFELRWHPPVSTRELLLRVESVLLREPSSNACVCINGRIYGPGESMEGFVVSGLGGDVVELRRDRILVRIPVSERPLRLRLAP